MTASKTLQIRASEIRQRLNAINGLTGDDYTAEIRTESDTLTNEFGDVETRLRAALVIEDAERVVAEREAAALGDFAGDPETRERLELRGKAKVGAFVSAALNSQAVTGAEAEYAAAVDCGTLNMIPISLFNRGRPEIRAITPGVDAQTTAHPTAPFVFERSIAASVLGIEFPVVPPGVANFPVITTAPPSGVVAKDAAALATAAAVRLDSRSPKRISGSFEVRTEDIATMPSLEADLQQSLMTSASNAIDEQVIAGTGVAPNLTGLFKLAADVAIAGAKETFATGLRVLLGSLMASMRTAFPIFGRSLVPAPSGCTAVCSPETDRQACPTISRRDLVASQSATGCQSWRPRAKKVWWSSPAATDPCACRSGRTWS